MSIIPIYLNKEPFFFADGVVDYLYTLLPESWHSTFGISRGTPPPLPSLELLPDSFSATQSSLEKESKKLDTKSSSEKTESEEGSEEISVNSENESLLLNIEEKENSKLYATGLFQRLSKRL
jgi:hypothetical protein